MNYMIKSHMHIFQPQQFFPKCHASTICLLPNGQLVAAWFAGSHEGAPDVDIWGAIYANHQWSTPQVIATGNGTPCWNPVLHATPQGLTLYYKLGKQIPTWCTMVQTSQDGGHTWGPATQLVPGDVGGRGPVRNKCLQLGTGRLLAPASVETDRAWDCFVDISDDGTTWHQSKTVPRNLAEFTGKGLIQPTLWEDANQVIHMLMRSTEGAIYKSLSQDQGQTWAMATKTQLPNNNCGIDVAKLADGRLVLVYNPVAGNWAARSPIAFTLSEDNGHSWGPPNMLDYVPCDPAVNIEVTEFSYPAIVADKNQVHITYTWKRDTLAYWQIQF